MSKQFDQKVLAILNRRRDRANDYASMLAELCHYRGAAVPSYQTDKRADGKIVGSIMLELDGQSFALESESFSKTAVRQILAGHALRDLGYITRVVEPVERPMQTQPGGGHVRFDPSERWDSRAAS